MKRDATRAEILDQPPPHNAEAEQAVLGSIILDPSTLRRAAEIVSPRDFFDRRHLAVYRSMLSADGRGLPVDHVTLLADLRDDSLIGGEDEAKKLIYHLAKFTPSAASIKYYARIVRDAAVKRRLREVGIALLQDAEGKSPDEAMADARAELEELARDGSSGVRYEVLTSAELDEAEYPLTYIIDGTLVLGQPCIVAGGKKNLKTTTLVALAIAVATGEPLFGKFHVRRQCRVLMMSGESGLATLQETFRRIARSMGVEPRGIDNLLWSPTLPKFGDTLHLDAFRRLIVEHALEVVVIDPAYLCMPGADAGNLFVQGDLLRSMNEVCQEQGVTLIIAHHTRKGGRADQFAPPELEDIAWAGFQEWARQWLLLGRRERYEPGTGEHRLWLSVGGSAGHGGLYGVDASEGTRSAEGGRHWSVDVLRSDEIRQDAGERKEQAKQAERQAKIDRAKKTICDVLAKFPEGETKTVIRDRASLHPRDFNPALAALLEAGDLVSCEVKKPNRKTPYEGYKLAAQTA